MPKRVALRKLVTRLGGARLTFGDAVYVGDRAIIPVARVNARGGMGYGGGDAAGGGGGGRLTASPVGFIDVGPEGSRFEAIPDPDRTPKLIAAGAAAAATLLVASAVRSRLLRARRRV
jgi:uncharacterized spore protein YtfJ